MQYEKLEEQIKEAIKILKTNEELMDILDYVSKLNLPNYYIASGCIYQTIWNYFDNKPLNSGIKDIDIIYFNKDDIKVDTDLKYYEMIKAYSLSKGYKYEIDVSNEARMHIYKKVKCNLDIRPYVNSEDAISRWIATVNAIGITKDDDIKIYAPYGLSDIYSKTIRPLKHGDDTKEMYYDKVESLKERFDNLNIVEW